MPRKPGVGNKPKEIADVIGADVDNEDKFLAELLAGKARWNKVARELKAKGLGNTREQEYSEAYQILLNRFSAVEAPEQTNQ